MPERSTFHVSSYILGTVYIWHSPFPELPPHRPSIPNRHTWKTPFPRPPLPSFPLGVSLYLDEYSLDFHF